MTYTRINNLPDLSKLSNIEYFIFFKGKLIPILSGRNILANSLYIYCQFPLQTEKFNLTQFTIINKSNIYVPIKIFVKCGLHTFEKKYVFVSPKEDVIFLSNRDGLFLNSGIIKHSSISQYGVLKRSDYNEKIRQGKIPLYPIGTGDVVGLFTLETVLKPYERTVANTWVMYSENHNDKNLIKWDRTLKSRLAFSKK
ncbi:hypothetical protein [Pallidibacillus thermolactis]|jgi:hypothetical protein|uniref:hypothetical protein n=1 Tax=Pallidibacillus thermolactis TaxID=251051 RepID=UPI00156AD9DC|nr:hypothetical protein [Pallidibacillus thermolactis]MCU9600523.1 hypothetical protein [Pallidibacillus thermolactis subsp. kokeshiiformis]MED1674432.1 hypothetical protein [Pallidibacillus thermolactis subsp. kokeshiiformis]